MCSVILSKRIHVAACGPFWTKFRTHMQIHLERVMGGKKFPVLPREHLGGFKGSEIDKCGKAAKQIGTKCFTHADSFRNEHRLNKIIPSRPQGEIWGVDVVKNSSIRTVAAQLD